MASTAITINITGTEMFKTTQEPARYYSKILDKQFQFTALWQTGLTTNLSYSTRRVFKLELFLFCYVYI